MTPAESAERARLVAAVEEARDNKERLYIKYMWDADKALDKARRALRAFDAAHKGEG